MGRLNPAKAKEFRKARNLKETPNLWLLSTNAKLEKSVPGYLLYGLQLAPHTSAGGKTVCASAVVAGCDKPGFCLYETGNGMYKNTQRGRINKTELLTTNPELFFEMLDSDIAKLKKKAESLGLKLAIRLNTYSDLDWMDYIKSHPDVQFYDYTKIPARLRKAEKVDNYHLTFSFSGNPAFLKLVKAALRYDANLAVVFKDKSTLEHYSNTGFLGRDVFDAVEHDGRFLDPKNGIAGLVAIGYTAQADNVFVVDKDFDQTPYKELR